MRVLYFTCMTLLSAMLGSLPSAIAAPGAYNFQLIADTTTGAFQDFYGYALNNSGTVAFSAALTGGGVGVFSSRGGSMTTILGNGGAKRGVAINDAGTVAFPREDFGGGTGGGLFTGSGGPITTIVSEGAIDYLAINNKGSIAFVWFPGDENPSMWFAENGRITQIPNSHEHYYPFINNSDIVLMGFYYVDMSKLQVSRAGEQPTLILDAASSPLPLEGFDSGVINDSGVIAFSSYERVDQSRPKTGIYTITDGALNAIIDTGPASPFQSVWLPVINNSGVIAFAANLKAGGTGIFTGPDPIGDKVIAVGDPLFGSTISQILFPGLHSRQWLNERGDVAFVAQLADGRKVIGLARPI